MAATVPDVLITDDFLNEIEGYQIAAWEEDDRAALKVLTDYALSLNGAAEYAEAQGWENGGEAVYELSAALLWIEGGCDREDFDEDGVEFDEQVIAALTDATRLMGELMIPLQEVPGGYILHPDAQRGRVPQDEPLEYRPWMPRATFAGQVYGFYGEAAL